MRAALRPRAGGSADRMGGGCHRGRGAPVRRAVRDRDGAGGDGAGRARDLRGRALAARPPGRGPARGTSSHEGEGRRGSVGRRARSRTVPRCRAARRRQPRMERGSAARCVRRRLRRRAAARSGAPLHRRPPGRARRDAAGTTRAPRRTVAAGRGVQARGRGAAVPTGAHVRQAGDRQCLLPDGSRDSGRSVRSPSAPDSKARRASARSGSSTRPRSTTRRSRRPRTVSRSRVRPVPRWSALELLA